jgi:hypothetical protein
MRLRILPARAAGRAWISLERVPVLLEERRCIILIAPVVEERDPLVEHKLRLWRDFVARLDHLVDVAFDEAVDALEELLASSASSTEPKECMMREDLRRAFVVVVLRIEEVINVLVAHYLRACQRDVTVDLLDILPNRIEALRVARATGVVFILIEDAHDRLHITGQHMMMPQQQQNTVCQSKGLLPPHMATTLLQ